MAYKYDFTTIRASSVNAAWLCSLKKDDDTVDDVLTRMRGSDG